MNSENLSGLLQLSSGLSQKVPGESGGARKWESGLAALLEPHYLRQQVLGLGVLARLRKVAMPSLVLSLSPLYVYTSEQCFNEGGVGLKMIEGLRYGTVRTLFFEPGS